MASMKLQGGVPQEARHLTSFCQFFPIADSCAKNNCKERETKTGNKRMTVQVVAKYHQKPTRRWSASVAEEEVGVLHLLKDVTW